MMLAWLIVLLYVYSAALTFIHVYLRILKLHFYAFTSILILCTHIPTWIWVCVVLHWWRLYLTHFSFYKRKCNIWGSSLRPLMATWRVLGEMATSMFQERRQHPWFRRDRNIRVWFLCLLPVFCEPNHCWIQLFIVVIVVDLFLMNLCYC